MNTKVLVIYIGYESNPKISICIFGVILGSRYPFGLQNETVLSGEITIILYFNSPSFPFDLPPTCIFSAAHELLVAFRTPLLALFYRRAWYMSSGKKTFI